MDRMRSYAPLAAVCLTLLFGCTITDEPGSPPEEPGKDRLAAASAHIDTVFAFISSIDQNALREAFGRMDQVDYTRYSRTEQFDADDRLIAFEERVTRHEGPPGDRRFVTVDRDSAGAFDFGYFSRFVSENVESYDPLDLPDHVIPEDPAYLSPRNKEAYVYRWLPDTLMLDATARVLEIRAHPTQGDEQNIRRVRLYVDKRGDRLIAVDLERTDLALWYREESRFYVHVRPMDGGGWLPYNTRFETRIRVPFRPIQRFRTVATYSESTTDLLNELSFQQPPTSAAPAASGG